MARGIITPYTTNRNPGLDLSTVVATVGNVANGHTIANRGALAIDVHNTNAGSTAHTVTVHLQGGADGQGVVPKPFPIPATKTIRLGPWPADIYGGQLLVDVDHAELTITAHELQL